MKELLGSVQRISLKLGLKYVGLSKVVSVDGVVQRALHVVFCRRRLINLIRFSYEISFLLLRKRHGANIERKRERIVEERFFPHPPVVW